jgi:hypothetical protein
VFGEQTVGVFAQSAFLSHLPERATDIRLRKADLPQYAGGGALIYLDQTEQEVLRADVVAGATFGLLVREPQRVPRVVGHLDPLSGGARAGEVVAPDGVVGPGLSEAEI